MSFVAAAVTASAVAGYVATNNAADRGANAMQNAANQSNDTQLQMYHQNRADYAPYRQAGYQALSQMQDPSFQKNFSIADYQADPGYAFRMAEGQKAIERSAAARGGLNSGATMKSLANYQQGLASDEYQNAYSRFTNDQNNRFNRLSSLAGLGQTANNATTSSGMSAANQISQNQLAVGNAQAAGSMASANALNNGLSNGVNTWMGYQMMNRFAPIK